MRDCLLFDLDGTLTDPKEGIVKCMLHALDSLEVPCETRDQLDWCIGPPLEESIEKLLGLERAPLLSEAVSLFRARYRTHGMYENFPYEGIHDALTRLKTRFRLFVATSKPEPIAVDVLKHFKLDGFFEFVRGSNLDGTRTRKAEVIAHLLQERGLEPARSAMIGDRMHDLVGARENGVPGFGVLWGYGSREELESHGPEGLFERPAQMSEYFLK